MEDEGQVRTLADGTEITIQPLKPDEYEKSLQFFKDLPEEDLMYLRVDVRDPEVVRKRLNTNPLENVFRLVVYAEDRIIADATLRWPQAGWMAHVGEIRIIISENFRGKGLATMLYRKLFIHAVRVGLEKIEAHMTPEQLGARKCVEKLGFREEGVLPGFVKDVKGNLRDLVIMSAHVEGF